MRWIPISPSAGTMVAGLLLAIAPPAAGAYETRVAATAAGDVVISEFAPAGPAGSTDEFLEFHNTSDHTVMLDGWDLTVCLPPRTSFVLVAFGPTHVIGPGGRLVLAHRDVGGLLPDMRYSMDVPEDGGWLLFHQQTWYSDGVGLTSGLTCTEENPATKCDWAAGEAATRDVQGEDSGNNAADFTCRLSTPGF